MALTISCRSGKSKVPCTMYSKRQQAAWFSYRGLREKVREQSRRKERGGSWTPQAVVTCQARDCSPPAKTSFSLASPAPPSFVISSIISSIVIVIIVIAIALPSGSECLPLHSYVNGVRHDPSNHLPEIINRT